MEFVHGQTLEDRVVAGGPIDWREASAIGVTICDALQAVHDAGLLHRDLKTHNVMQEPSGRVAVMDFHASRPTGVPPIGTEMIGTPLFLAPEVLIEQRPASVQSDVYSAGVILYRLLTASYPIDGGTIDELRLAFHRGRFVRLKDRRPDLPREVLDAVDSAIHTDPGALYRDRGGTGCRVGARACDRSRPRRAPQSFQDASGSLGGSGGAGVDVRAGHRNAVTNPRWIRRAHRASREALRVRRVALGLALAMRRPLS